MPSSKDNRETKKCDTTTKTEAWEDSPPSVIETKRQDSDGFAQLDENDNDDSTIVTSQGHRPYRSSRRVWPAILLWVGLLIITLSRGKVPERTDINLDAIFNTTLLPHLEHHLRRIQQSVRTQTNVRLSPGEVLAKKGARVHFPVIIIPGFVTSGLELWEGKPCAKKYFRQRLWGALGTARTFFTETECWRQHLSLDPLTGMDPPGIRLRAAQGFEAADYFMTGYWVWDKLIKQFAAVGYDGSTMSIHPFDWRLAFPLLEERDGFFTKLMHNIEAMHKTMGRKVVIVSHSMGSQVMTFFFAWVTRPERDGGGGGGKDWVEKHVFAFVNIAGPLLGVPKSITSIMSGEFKDTNVLMGTFGTMLEQFFGRRRRKELWSSWGSLWAMLPKGGHSIWGPGADMCVDGMLPAGLTCIPASEADPGATAPFVVFTNHSTSVTVLSKNDCATDECLSSLLDEVVAQYSEKSAWTIDETLAFLSKWGVGYGRSHAGPRFHCLLEDERRKKSTPMDWTDPTTTPLPHAPSLKIYCLYGVGLETERAFFYKHNTDEFSEGNETSCTAAPADLPFVMDGSVEDSDQNIKYGVRTTDGDASVPLLSLGYMCVEGWKERALNPSRIAIVTREYPHSQEFVVEDPIRGGPKSGEHVDILGNVNVMEDVLRIVTDYHPQKVKTRIVSDIENIASRIRAHPGGPRPPRGFPFHLYNGNKRKPLISIE